MKVIAISGTPGTGKTSLAIKLSKILGFIYLDANKLIKKYNLAEGYDAARKSIIVDVTKLNKILVKESNSLKRSKSKNSESGVIIDSHLSHYLSKRQVDLCIITKCDIKVLHKRLKKRGYDKNKILENLQAEVFDVCYNEALERRHNILIANSTKGFKIKDIITMVNKKMKVAR